MNQVKVHKASRKFKVLSIGGVDFVVDPRGTKLVRKTEDGAALPTVGRRTPKFVNVNGVGFVRSKTGNLILAPKSKRSDTIRKPKRKSKYCQYHRFGLCKNSNCRFVHDPDRIAICTRYLKDQCDDPHCRRSHRPTDKNVADCLHFSQAWGCKNEKCPYRHVKLGDGAPVCRDFAYDRYCEQGNQCQSRHVIECPDFAAGKCENPRCKLPHGPKERPSRERRGGGEIKTAGEEEDLAELLRMPIRPDFDDDREDMNASADEEEDSHSLSDASDEDELDFMSDGEEEVDSDSEEDGGSLLEVELDMEGDLDMDGQD
ncbi:hypothetical protein HDV00_002846 [Rhizophlyctis rosea]|nr:hypothetical protein HDV00_002846 [Rhizophlyctis rosea]